MRTHFLNSLISVLLTIVIIPGLIPCIVSAADGQFADNGNSTNSTLTSNLILENLSTDPESPKPDSKAVINSFVKNVGNKTSEPTNIIYIIGETEEKEEVPAIEAGSEKLISHTWTTPNEEETVTIKASLENVENSGKEISVKIEEESLPDLIIEDLSPESSTQPEAGKTLNFTLKIKNDGEATANNSTAKYSSNGTSGEISIPELSTGESAIAEFSLTPGNEENMNVTVVADSENTISESNEDNNKMSKTISVKSELPDLIIEDLSPESSAQPEAGKTLNFTLKIKNDGEATANNSTAKYSSNGTSGEISIPELSAGTSTSAEFSLIPGNEENMSVTVVADYGNLISESNEDNNKMSKTINVKRKLPDLKIESISLSPEEPHPGENITFTVTVKNNGSAAAEKSEIKYDIKGNNESYTGVTSIPVLAAGETGTGTFFWTPGNEGQIEVKATADAKSVVSESDETNNEFTKNATVYKETVSSDDGGSGSSGSSGSDSGSKSSGSSSGGSGGVSLSKEPVSNVEAKELATGNVQSGYHIKFDFLEGATCITYIEFDPIKILKRTITTVEMLKDKSVFVSGVPPGKIYKYVNIWVGNYGAGVANYCENGVIEFKVEKPWLEENNVNKSQIILQWYNESWEPLDTEKVKEDTDYIYFKSETPGFSCFAITNYSVDGENVSVASEQAEEDALINLDGEAKTSIHNESSEKDGEAKDPMGKAKIFLAISLPLFLILVEYFVMKKKI